MRLLVRGLALLLALALAATAAGYIWLRRSLPQTQGTLQLQGLHAPVEVLRDAYDIPHIFAKSEDDAYFALGFVHAQERLWQMEMSRRIGSGRLAEVLGPAALPTDRFIRTLGLRRAAEANYAHYDARTRAALEAYAAGVNAYLGTHPVLPPEFWILRVKPAPWTPIDSVVWTKVMALNLAGNWRNELLRLRLAKRLSPKQIEQFLRPQKTGTDPISGKMGSDPNSGLGSNSWVVSGAHTASGKPLLANDPHLDLTAPSVWFLAQLSAPGLDVIGATLPGVPGVVLGRNDRIAWGFTNTGPDVQDFFEEKLEPGDRYLTPDGPRPFKIIDETIKVRGAPDQTLRVRVSRHGPVLSDVLPSAQAAAPPGTVLALRWTALDPDDRSMQALLELDRARDWKSFLAATRDFYAPMQNVTYADVDGHIGFIAAGHVPLRKPANEVHGLAPVPGWEARYDWAGSIPFDKLPQRFDPPSGEIVTANQDIAPPGYPYRISNEWEPPYRAQRIQTLLGEARKQTIASFAHMQADVVSLPLRALLPKWTAIHGTTVQAERALALLRAWDGTMAADRPEPLIAVAWWREIARKLYADELGPVFPSAWAPRAPFLEEVFSDANGASSWCNDIHTPVIESCKHVLRGALDAALADLRRRYGGDLDDWRWGVAHATDQRHRPFSHSALLSRFFDLRVPVPGGEYTVDVGRTDFADDAEPYASLHGPSLRAIYDLADPQNSLFIQSTGQSGNPLSRHYRDFAGPWSKVEYVPMLTDRARIEAGGVRRLVLEP